MGNQNWNNNNNNGGGNNLNQNNNNNNGGGNNSRRRNNNGDNNNGRGNNNVGSRNRRNNNSNQPKAFYFYRDAFPSNVRSDDVKYYCWSNEHGVNHNGGTCKRMAYGTHAQRHHSHRQQRQPCQLQTRNVPFAGRTHRTLEGRGDGSWRQRRQRRRQSGTTHANMESQGQYGHEHGRSTDYDDP